MMQSLSRAQNCSTVPEIKSRKSFFYENVLWPIMTPIDSFTREPADSLGLCLPTRALLLTVLLFAAHNQRGKIECEKKLQLKSILLFD